MELELEIAAHEVEHAAVARGFVEALHGRQHDHVRPEVGPGPVVDRAEVPVAGLRLEGLAEPALGLLADGGVLEQVAEVAVALEPVGHLFPALAFQGDPAAVVPEKAADLGQPAREAVPHELELGHDPAPGFDRAERELDERADGERGAVGRVVRIGRDGRRDDDRFSRGDRRPDRSFVDPIRAARSGSAKKTAGTTRCFMGPSADPRVRPGVSTPGAGP